MCGAAGSDMRGVIFRQDRPVPHQDEGVRMRTREIGGGTLRAHAEINRNRVEKIALHRLYRLAGRTGRRDRGARDEFRDMLEGKAAIGSGAPVRQCHVAPLECKASEEFGIGHAEIFFSFTQAYPPTIRVDKASGGSRLYCVTRSILNSRPRRCHLPVVVLVSVQDEKHPLKRGQENGSRAGSAGSRTCHRGP